MFHRIIIYFINQINITVIRFLNPVGNQQECISHIGQDIFRNIISCIQIHYGKIMDGRFIAFFLKYSTCIDKCPSTVRIVIQRKFFLFAILFQHKNTFIYTRFRSIGNRHPFRYILSNLIRPEV